MTVNAFLHICAFVKNATIVILQILLLYKEQVLLEHHAQVIVCALGHICAIFTPKNVRIVMKLILSLPINRLMVLAKIIAIVMEKINALMDTVSLSLRAPIFQPVWT